MSKVLTETEVLDIIKRIITGDDVISDAVVYGKFLKDLGNLVASYCGGECVAVSSPLGDGELDDTAKIILAAEWCVHFRADEAVPADGGVFAGYDTDVTVEEWKQEKPEDDDDSAEGNGGAS